MWIGCNENRKLYSKVYIVSTCPVDARVPISHHRQRYTIWHACIFSGNVWGSGRRGLLVVGEQKWAKTYWENFRPRQKQQVDRLVGWIVCRSRRHVWWLMFGGGASCEAWSWNMYHNTSSMLCRFFASLEPFLVSAAPLNRIWFVYSSPFGWFSSFCGSQTCRRCFCNHRWRCPRCCLTCILHSHIRSTLHIYIWLYGNRIKVKKATSRRSRHKCICYVAEERTKDEKCIRRKMKIKK